MVTKWKHWNIYLTATDLEDEDNEKRERTDTDIAALHRFYPKHLELPDHKDLLTLYSQVPQRLKYFLCFIDLGEQIAFFIFFIYSDGLYLTGCL